MQERIRREALQLHWGEGGRRALLNLRILGVVCPAGLIVPEVLRGVGGDVLGGSTGGGGTVTGISGGTLFQWALPAG